MRSSSKAFTLVELLVTIAIIAILAVVVVTTINPMQLLAQSRDGNRISDMRNLNGTISFYKSDQLGSSQFSLGSSSVVYVSLPDPAATTAAGSNCASLNLPVLPSPYSYHCAGPNYYRKTNGTGWIPVNLSLTSTGAPLSSFPIDPTNASSSRLFYTYTTNGSQFEFTAAMESTKYKLGGSNDQVSGDGGLLAGVYEKGTQLGLEPVDYGDSSLVGYWPMNEGSGNFAFDASGNNATGMWSGTQAGTNGTHYSPGKVGPYAGAFDGTDNFINSSSSRVNIVGNITLSAWINPSAGFGQQGVICTDNYYSGFGIYVRHNAGSDIGFQINPNGTRYNTMVGTLTYGRWSYVAETWNGTNLNAYINGVNVYSGQNNNGISPRAVTHMTIGYCGGISAPLYFLGSLDDVRIYNRALSAAEIQAMYNAGK